jgi:predicted DNA-binding transcriptional regulator YafY
MKLLAAMPEATRAEAEKVAQRFHVDPVAWFQSAEEHAHLPALAAAVWGGRQIRMRYDSWEKVVERDAAPLGLVLKGGLWYLVAAVDRQPRTYRVASILDLAVLDAPAAPIPKFNLQKHWAAFARDYETRMQSGTARIAAQQGALRELARLSAAMAAAVRVAGPADGQGWRTLDIPIESVSAAVPDLLRFGARVRVLAPAELVRAMRAAVHDLASLYRPGKG